MLTDFQLEPVLHRSRYGPFAAHLLLEGPIASDEGREVYVDHDFSQL